MLTRRHIVVAAAGALALGTALTLAPVANAAPQTYSQQAFAAAQDAGKPILLHITAPWCPTCKAQKPIVGKLDSEPKFKNLVVLDIDFDSQKALLRKLHVTQQSTLIAYKGKTEVGRSVGDTNAASIAALVGKTL
jgi:thiol-disulfide isomerase/thioredoxin